MKKICWLCLGSNERPDEHLATARRLLQARFGEVRFAPVEITRPIDFPYPAPFVNQVALLATEEDAPEVKAAVKAIETACGRQPADKVQGLVKMDIDLLAHDGQVLKPADWQRDYVQQGLKALSANSDGSLPTATANGAGAATKRDARQD